mmetsp:Transcript_15280/g.35221  ORF Transcript_15280/g.35221 Transcript_15280/m.35221 type:complete len:210 (-) Transcript_15280:193-822(-)
MGPTNLDNVGVLLALLGERGVESLEARECDLRDHLGDRYMHGGRKGVVAGLSHVDVVVGVDGGFGSDGTAQNLDRAVRQDLVDVHVGLGARSGLEDDQGEVLVQLSVHDLVRGLRNRASNRGFHLSDLGVVFGAAFFDQGHGVDNLEGHLGFGPADGKVYQRSLGLASVEAVGWDVQGTHAVRFNAGRQADCGIRIRRCIRSRGGHSDF